MDKLTFAISTLALLSSSVMLWVTMSPWAFAAFAVSCALWAWTKDDGDVNADALFAPIIDPLKVRISALEIELTDAKKSVESLKTAVSMRQLR